MVENDIDYDHFAGAVSPSFVRRVDLPHKVRNDCIMRMARLLDAENFFVFKTLFSRVLSAY